ncbi:hypothetical protein BST85_03510 [Aureitalea marina]|uniref:HTH LytTR-type domain-containing protein n=1 Tax=Aureitalea marina TaxID=930804 RepID=A0A2S7KTI1_9FLAO|nr:hypothetical protein BST85_03510 [Aureitalea marina]
MGTFLKQPYPYYYRGRSLIILLGLLFLASTSFNYFFEPFGNNPAEMKFSFFWICVIHSLNAGLTIALVVFVAHFVVDKDNWTTGRELLLWSIFLLAVGIAQFFIRDFVYDNPRNWTTRYLLEEIRNTYLIGGILLLMLVSLNFNRLYFQNRVQAQSIIIQPRKRPDQNRSIAIRTTVQQDNFSLNPDAFVYAHSEKNYLNLYLEVAGTTQQKLIRMPMKQLDDQLEDISDLVRVHRSYLVNLRRVLSVEGNASGYQLQLEGATIPIPVSRSFIPSFQERMESMG